MATAIDIPADRSYWDEGPADDIWLLYRGEVRVGGVPMHLEALKVRTVDGEQQGATTEAEEKLNSLADVVQPDGPWETVTINGEEYVVVMTPYC